MDGLLVIDKPVGPTSHDVVARLRRTLDERRVGHTGTLDPTASGVLPLVLGRATRLARFLIASDKSYDAVIRLGVATNTYDSEGVPLGPPHSGLLPDRAAINQALDAFRGTFLQQPPRYSAKKIGGRRSHRIARAYDERVRLKPDPAELNRSDSLDPPASLRLRAVPGPVSVTVYAIDILTVDGDTITLRVDCSAGFYVRSLAHDLGRRLGVGAHLARLCRTRSGDLTLDDAIPLAMAENDLARLVAAIIPPGRMLPHLPAAVLTREGTKRAEHGRDLGLEHFEKGDPSPLRGAWPQKAPMPLFVRLLDPAGDLIGLAEPSAAPGVLHPSVVLV